MTSNPPPHPPYRQTHMKHDTSSGAGCAASGFVYDSRLVSLCTIRSISLSIKTTKACGLFSPTNTEGQKICHDTTDMFSLVMCTNLKTGSIVSLVSGGGERERCGKRGDTFRIPRSVIDSRLARRSEGKLGRSLD